MPAVWVATREIPVSDLTRFPGNPRKGDVERLRESIRANGQYRSLVVREGPGGTLTVLAGNHTLDALTAEGSGTARCEVITCTDGEAARINVADNRIADLGEYDDRLLADLLATLDDPLGTGYTDDEFDELLRHTDALGDPAVAFLDDVITAAAAQPPAPAGVIPDTAGTTTASNGNGVTPPEYVQVSWLVTVPDRAAIREALNVAMERWQLPTSAEALTAMAREFLTQKAPTP